MMLRIKGIVVETGDGYQILVYPKPYGFAVLNAGSHGGLPIDHPDIDLLDARIKREATELAAKFPNGLSNPKAGRVPRG